MPTNGSKQAVCNSGKRVVCCRAVGEDGSPSRSSSAIQDVIVVGAGHNGLIAACYLARAGMSVLVLEAHGTVGGLTSTAEMLPEAPGHIINEGGIQASQLRATTIVGDLELESRFGLRQRVLDPAHVQLGLDGESFAVWADPRRTADEIRRLSVRDAKAWIEFSRVADAAIEISLPFMQTNPIRPEPKKLARALRETVRHRRCLRELAPWLWSSHAEIVNTRFEHPLVRGLFGAGLAYSHLEDDCTGLIGVIYMGLLHRYGVSMFEGGTGALPNALVRCLLDGGGEVRTSTPVEQLLIDSGPRVVGVRVESGEEFRARTVLTACNVKTALTRLLPAGVLAPTMAERVSQIPTARTGAATFKLDVAVKGKLTLRRHDRWRGDGLDLRLPCNSLHTIPQTIAAFEACQRGELPDPIPGLAQITTALDPAMAPAGHDTMWFWTGLTPARPIESWETLRDRAADRIVQDLGQFYEGIEELEIGRRALAAPDLERRFWALDGNVYHVDPLPFRSGPLRPALGLGGYRTPVEGLFLTASGTHPAAGISGMPGQNAARTLIRHVKPAERFNGRTAQQFDRALEFDRDAPATALSTP